MSIIKRNNGNGYNSIPDLFDDVFTRNLFDWGMSNYSTAGTTLPAVNIKETAENFEVEMAAPGMKKDDFQIQLDGNTLTISAENRESNDQREDERYSRREFRYQSFMRTFTLPRDVVDLEQIHAKYDNGVLQLLIPKREEAKQKPPKTITVS